MATTTFDKRIVLDSKAADNMAKAPSFDKTKLSNVKEQKISGISELREWFSHLKK